MYSGLIHQWLENIGITAAWVQAWGSIGALSVALMLAFYNQKHEINREKTRQAQYMEAIYSINQKALKATSEIIDEMNSSALHHHGINTSELELCLQSLSTVSLESLSNAKGYLAVFQLRKNLSAVLNFAENKSNYGQPEGILPWDLEEIEGSYTRAIHANTEFAKSMKSL